MAQRTAVGPVRRCAVCRTVADKRALHRVVRAPDGSVRFDPGGKAAGRGAYLCGREDCVQVAASRPVLQRALRVEVEQGATVRAAVEDLRKHSRERDKDVRTR